VNNNLKVCRVEVENAEIITKTKTMAYRDEKEKFKPIDEKVPKWFYDEWYVDIEETKRLIKSFFCYKVLLEDKVIGTFWLRNIDEKTIELEDFCILPEFQGRGYGFKLLSMMENLYPKISKWSLTTPFYSVRNHHLYEKAGYIKVGTRAEDTVFLYEKIIPVK
jgi:GNAT superfamily N-acetyltransferase